MIFFEVKGDGIIDVNKRGDSEIGELYKDIKSDYYESQDVFKRKINSKFVKHFFNKEEIEMFKGRYSGDARLTKST